MQLSAEQPDLGLGDTSGTGPPAASKPLDDEGAALYSGPEGARDTAAPPLAAQLGQGTVPLSQVLLSSGSSGGGGGGKETKHACAGDRGSAAVAAPHTPELHTSGGGSVRGGTVWLTSDTAGAEAEGGSADLLILLPSPKQPLSSPKQRPSSPIPLEAASCTPFPPEEVLPGGRSALQQAGRASILKSPQSLLPLLLSPWQRSEAQVQAAELEMCGGLLVPGGQLLAAKRAYLLAMQVRLRLETLSAAAYTHIYILKTCQE